MWINLLWQTQGTVLFLDANRSLLPYILRQNVLPCLLLFFSFLPSPLDTPFLYSECSGSSALLLWGDLPGLRSRCVCTSLFWQSLSYYLILHAPHRAGSDALSCRARKTQLYLQVPAGMEVAEPRSRNPGLTRHSGRRNMERHLWTSHLPVTEMSGGPSWGLCGGREDNVKIMWAEARRRSRGPRNPGPRLTASISPLTGRLGTSGKLLASPWFVFLSEIGERSYLSQEVLERIS